MQQGEVEADTNLIENAIRPTTVGKKTGWSAVIYTIIGKAERHGHEQAAYLNEVLERLSGMKAGKLDTLLGESAAHRPSRELQHKRRAEAGYPVASLSWSACLTDRAKADPLNRWLGTICPNLGENCEAVPCNCGSADGRLLGLVYIGQAGRCREVLHEM